MKYVLTGRVAAMDRDFTVLQAGAVYIHERSIVAVQDRTAPPPPTFAAVPPIAVSGIMFPGSCFRV